MRAHHVAFLIFDDCQILDLTGPHEVFAGANQWLADHPEAGHPGYQLSIVAPTLTVRSESGLSVAATHTFDAPLDPVGTALVVGGNGVDAQCADPQVVGWLQAHAASADRFGSVCSGTFLLGAAGLINGRRVTTHWARAAALAAQYPEAMVDPDPIHIVDGECWTSAGVTAGIDMALAMVEADLGARCAQMCARWLVMFLRRAGGQSQFATALWANTTEHGGVRAAVDRVTTDPGADHRIRDLAAVAAMSERNFARVFTRELGMSPGRFVERVRLDAAKRLLETSDLSTQTIARSCGFGSAETLRRSFQRRLSTSPSDYRRGFTPIGSPNPTTNPKREEVIA